MKYQFDVQVGPVGFRIGSAWRAPIRALENMYAAYPKLDGQVADFTVRLEPAKPWRRYFKPSVMIEGDFMLPDAAPLALEHGLLAAEMGMNLQMALGWRRHLLLHASAVERDGRVLLMTGMSGSGKSTLSALLGEKGWRFLGDEFALLDLENGEICPFPRLISLKNEAIKAMQGEVAANRFGPLMEATPKGDIRHMRPNEIAVDRMQESAKPALLLFPRFGHSAEVRELGKSEIFVRLTQASTNYVALGEQGFRALTRFVDDVPARAIDYANGDEAIALVERLWQEYS